MRTINGQDDRERKQEQEQEQEQEHQSLVGFD